MSGRQLSRAEVATHDSRRSAFVVIDNVVYDLTAFLEDHPGGADVLLNNAGKDASRCFHEVGHSDIALEWRRKFVVGAVPEEERREEAAQEAARQAEAGAEEADSPLTLRALLDVWGAPVLLAGLAVLAYLYLLP